MPPPLLPPPAAAAPSDAFAEVPSPPAARGIPPLPAFATAKRMTSVDVRSGRSGVSLSVIDLEDGIDANLWKYDGQKAQGYHSGCNTPLFALIFDSLLLKYYDGCHKRSSVLDTPLKLNDRFDAFGASWSRTQPFRVCLTYEPHLSTPSTQRTFPVETTVWIASLLIPHIFPIVSMT